MAPYKTPELGKAYPAKYIFYKGELFTTDPSERITTVTHRELAARDRITRGFAKAAQADPTSVYAASYMVVGDRITVYQTLPEHRTLDFRVTKKGYENAFNRFRELSPGFEVLKGEIG